MNAQQLYVRITNADGKHQYEPTSVDPYSMLERPMWPEALAANELYERRGDMSPNGLIRIILQDDGDVCLAVVGENNRFASIEFCTLTGGGKSSRVRSALLILAEAIRRDNVERPQV